MTSINRREFISLLAGTGAMMTTVGSLLSCSRTGTASARVVIVGGGFGGSTCAKYLKKFDPMLDVTLVTSDARFITCPFSNAVLGGIRDINSISHGYDIHRKNGINIVNANVSSVDPVNKRISLDSGKAVQYDRLVLSPGIDFKWDEVEGMQVADAEKIPHAWQGGSQTTILQKQLLAMRDGGVFMLVAPGNPFRCPPGPYERVSLIAHYLATHKPKSKILILDAKDKFSKQPLFMQGWEKLYPGMIEWVAGSKGGRIESVDVNSRMLMAENGDKHTADVINFIPPQKAAPIVHTAGLTNSDGWCPVNQRSFESKLHPDIYVIGDASIAGKMPKSGFAANSQAKVCAAAIVSDVHGTEMPEPSYVNTCYSLVSPEYGISVAAVYRYNKDKGIYKVKGSGGVSPKDADSVFRKQEAAYAAGWYDSITSDAFG